MADAGPQQSMGICRDLDLLSTINSANIIKITSYNETVLNKVILLSNSFHIRYPMENWLFF